MNDKYDVYRKLLIKAGFNEALNIPNHFYKKATEKTAFIINLKKHTRETGVMYGFCSTAFMAGDQNFLKQYGVFDDDCNLRNYVEIVTERDAEYAKAMIDEFYLRYRNVEKDELLNIVKEKRKLFMTQITSILKPLGFRKKGNRWNKEIAESQILLFWADKSSYTDLYYFEVGTYSLKSSSGRWCYNDRIETISTDRFDWKWHSTAKYEFDWQLQSSDDLLKIMDYALQNYLLPFINMNLEELGKQKFIWEGCTCSRNCCEKCWVQKNLWEAKEV